MAGRGVGIWNVFEPCKPRRLTRLTWLTELSLTLPLTMICRSATGAEMDREPQG